MRSKKLSLMILGAMVLQSHAFAQFGPWSSMPSANAHFTPLRFDRYPDATGAAGNEKYGENTAHLGLTVPLNERLRVGLLANLISIRAQGDPVDRALLGAAVLQYNLTPRRRLGFYLETGYALSNHCTCGSEESYSSQELIHFLPMGFGLDYPLLERARLKAGFTNYHPLKGPEDVYNFTQPFVGLNVYFGQKYRLPFHSKFGESPESPESPQRESWNPYWTSAKRRTWNFGVSSSGASWSGPEDGGFEGRHTVFSVFPRLNRWLNQAVMVGAQAGFFRYSNTVDIPAESATGLGVGAQARFYPLSFRDPSQFRALKVGSGQGLQFSPTFGVEFHFTSFSWEEPELAGQQWRYLDLQPHVGFVLTVEENFSLFWSYGPYLSLGDAPATAAFNGPLILGLEYDFGR